MIARAAGLALAAVGLAAGAAHAGAPAGDAHAAEPSPAPGPARPSPPDPGAAEQASDANFAPASPHRGFLIGAALGPAMQLGFGIADSSGTGPGFSLRIGTAATRRLSWLLEVANTGYLHDVMSTPPVDPPKRAANTSALLAVGGQYYLRDVVWVRAGVGLATFTLRSQPGTKNKVFFGAGALAGAGFDLLRRGRFALSLEFTVLGSRYREGFIGGGFSALGASFY